jgi:hypothetical protein
MIIWLASYPRSGNSLASLALKHLFGYETRTIYSDAAREEVVEIQRFLGDPVSESELRQIDRANKPFFVKTHELPTDDEHPALYLVRDGRDAMVSYAHYILQTEQDVPTVGDRETFLRVLSELIMTDGHFGGWSSHVLAWTCRKIPTVAVRFEDIVLDPGQVLARTLADIGQLRIAPNGGSLPSFEDLHRAFPWFFRHGRTGAWKSEMPEILHQLFWRRHSEAMAAFDYRAESSAGSHASVSSERHEKALQDSLLIINDLRQRMAMYQAAACERLQAMIEKDQLILRLHTEAARLRAQLKAATVANKADRA